ncbi:MAG TPA: hypothetical protein VJL29_04080 [Thermoguttaceae bacterium]|nr:hypothetical protein [Thermoguttaceae bacterium]
MLKTRMAGIAVALCLLVMFGCSAVTSKHPLSDEKTSKPDTRLLGTWKGKTNEENGWRIVAHPKSENALMAFDLPGKLDDSADLLLTTELGGKKYFSWGGRDSKSGKTHFFICRYEMPNESTLRLRFLSIDAIRKAITDKRLSGRVTVVTEKKAGKLDFEQRETVRITAEMDELRSFLEANGDACFPKGKDADTVFVRVIK